MEHRFSLVEGGPLYRLARRAGLSSGNRGLAQLGLLLAAVTWLPLAVLNALQGAAGDAAVSFTWSLGTHVRFLVTIPLFFLAEAYFGERSRQALDQLVASNLVRPSDVGAFRAMLARALRWRDSALVEVALVALTIALILSGVRSDLPNDASNWRMTSAGTDERFTAAGWWYIVVSLPVFQFLCWRWCWRLLIWWVLLGRMARLDLRLNAKHPDLAGGLGGLGVAHTDLMPLNFGVSAMLVATYAEDVLFGGVELQRLVLPLAGIVLGMTVLAVTPLLFFTPRLVTVKQRGLLEYGVLAAAYTEEFDAKWLRGGAPPGESLLGTADLQALADLTNSFEVVRDMRMVPIGLSQVLLLAAAAILPMLPLLLTVFPLDELIVRSVKSLIGM